MTVHPITQMNPSKTIEAHLRLKQHGAVTRIHLDLYIPNDPVSLGEIEVGMDFDDPANAMTAGREAMAVFGKTERWPNLSASPAYSPCAKC